MLKVGDIVICKKNRYQPEYGIIYNVNESYTITGIDKILVYVNYRGFNKTYKDRYYSFDDYFYTKQDFRKQKLQKLCSNQEIE